MDPESESTETAAAAAPPAENSAPAPAPKSRAKPAGIAGAVAVLGLVVFTAIYGFPVNLYCLAACIPLIIANDARTVDKWWARALRTLMKPVAEAMALLAVLVALLKFFKPSGTTTVINWEERTVLHLHQWLGRHPSWWEYTLLLAAATLLSWRIPAWKPVGRLEKAKGWLDASVSLIAVLASVSFLGEQTVVKGRYNDLNYDLWLRYTSAKHRQLDNQNHALAARAVAQSLASADGQTRSDLHVYFEQMADLKLSDEYDSYLGREAMDRAWAGQEGGPQPPGERAGDPIDRASTPEQELPLVEKQVAAADAAAKENADAQEGLRKIVETLGGAATGKLLDAAIGSAGKHFFDGYIDRLSQHIGSTFDPLLEALQDKANEQLKERIQEQENRAIDDAMNRIDWKNIPHGSAEEVASAIKADAVEIAQARRGQAIDTLKRVAREASGESHPDEIDQLRAEANDAASEAQGADGVLGRFAPEDKAAADVSGGSPGADWKALLDEANQAVDRAQSTEEKTQEEKQRVSEPER